MADAPIESYYRKGMLITPSAHEKSEWSRMAQAAYAADYNAVGHRYSVAASVPHDFTMALAYYDKLQAAYRSWLCWNDFKAADYCVRQSETRPEYSAIDSIVAAMARGARR